MLGFHRRKERILRRQADEQAMATAHIGIPSPTEFPIPGRSGVEAHRAMTNSLPDEDLMVQVREGVGEMLAVLFDRYQNPLFNFYCRLTGDRTLSEDLVQDGFYRILKYRHTYRPGTSFRSWMYQIARNARLDNLKKQHVEVPVEPDAATVVPID